MSYSILLQGRVLILAAIVLFPPSPAGTLDEFEQEVIKGEEHPSDPPPAYDPCTGGDPRCHHTHPSRTDDDNDDDGFLSLVFGGLLVGGDASWARVQDARRHNEAFADLEPRRPGDILIPYARLDLGYQDVDATVDARDIRGEIGYGPFAVQARRTLYEEQAPQDKLELIQIHGLYRMSLGNHVEVDLGMGSMRLKGNADNSGFSVTTPILIYPVKHFGIEVRPAWSSINNVNVGDFDVALVGSRRFVSVRGGYRRLKAGSQVLDGPQAGVSVHW